MTAPHYINEHEADIRAIKPGWYEVENNGKRSSGPFPSCREYFTRINPLVAGPQEDGPLDVRRMISSD
jgi:hypothetical protein